MIWDTRLDQLHVTISKVDKSQPYWGLVAAWITINGDWGAIPEPIKSQVVKWQRDTLGGDHNVFCRLEGNGQPVRLPTHLFWPDGDVALVQMPDGWDNQPIYGDYDPITSSGGYGFGPKSGEQLIGVGIPRTLPWLSTMGGFHVSFFGVWNEITPSVSKILKGRFTKIGPFSVKIPMEIEFDS
jgi:hypothetical protein